VPTTPTQRESRRRQVDRAGLGGGLGARLREARQSRNVGLRELARRIGVSPSLVSQIETGKSVPSVSTLSAIVSELDLSANEIVFEPKEAESAAPASARPERSSGTSPLGRAAAEGSLSSGGRSVSLVQRANDRRRIHLDTGVVWDRLTAGPDHDVDFLLIHYPPGGESTAPNSLMRHNGTEYGIVLSGRFLVSIGFDDYELGPGDSIAFDSTQPHRLATLGDEPVEAIWFVVGRHH
jgi:transcriptional regulator with XRE-family HTH domain/quercetin dioxygenase-like cupin family protein